MIEIRLNIITKFKPTVDSDFVVSIYNAKQKHLWCKKGRGQSEASSYLTIAATKSFDIS